MTLNEKVKFILSQNADARDNDAILYCDIIQEYYDIDCNQVTALFLLVSISTRDIPSFETVSRRRREVQEEFPDLRGMLYQTRRSTELQMRAERRRKPKRVKAQTELPLEVQHGNQSDGRDVSGLHVTG